jgi:hypothetical protein
MAEAWVNHVRYAPRVLNQQQIPDVGANPFVKSDRFAQEQEIRIVWFTKPGIEPIPFNTRPHRKVRALLAKLEH